MDGIRWTLKRLVVCGGYPLSELSQLLRELNDVAFDAAELRVLLPEHVKAAQWCGDAPALEDEIQATERRLGIRLPPSYREFLGLANGWHVFDYFVPKLWSTEEIDWYRAVHPDWLEQKILAWQKRGVRQVSDAEYFDYTEPQSGFYRPEHLANCLLIGEGIDAELVFLNPRVISEGGEWEAWYFASWIPGANRYRSFKELCQRNLEASREEFMGST